MTDLWDSIWREQAKAEQRRERKQRITRSGESLEYRTDQPSTTLKDSTEEQPPADQ